MSRYSRSFIAVTGLLDGDGFYGVLRLSGMYE